MKAAPFELTISAKRAQLYSFFPTAVCIPAMAISFTSYWNIPTHSITGSTASHVPILMVIFIVGIMLHEMIHAFTAMLVAKIGWHNVRIGFQARSLTPYFHSKVPVKASSYRIVLLMPLILLGFFPYIYAFFTGNGWLAVIGIIFTVAAAGDVMIFWMMRHVQPNQMVQDHPEKIGISVL